MQRRLNIDLRSGVHETTVVRWLVGFHLGTLMIILMPILSDFTPFRVAVVFFDLTVVPGVLFLIALDELDLTLDRLLYVVGTSLILVMATGVALNITLPLVGFYRPLAVPSLVFGLTALVIALGYVSYSRANARDRSIHVDYINYTLSPLVVLSLLLLPATVIAIDVLQGQDQNLPIIAVLSIIAVMPLAITLRSRLDWYPLVVYGISLALLYHTTLSSQAHGASSRRLTIMEMRRWTPGVGEVTSTSTSLVPNGVLYPMYAILSDIPLYLQSGHVNPILVSLLPVTLFQIYRRYVSDRSALLGVSIFMFAHPFYRLYPGGGRVSTPVIFLAVVGLLIADDSLGSFNKKLFSIIFASGIIVSHYGTSYYAMLAFFGAFALVKVFPYVEKAIASISDRGHSMAADAIQFSTERNGQSVLTVTFVCFFGVFVMAWYMYTFGGGHFSLPVRIAGAIQGLYEGALFTGKSANRLQKSYGYNTTSIRLARYIYIGLVGLMLFGLVSELLRRFVSSLETRFQDEYLGTAAVLLAFAGSSFLLPVGWGGGRPMMIAFTFVAVFAVVGSLTGFEILRFGLGKVMTERNLPSRDALRGVCHSGFAVVLAVFLLLNTGVMAATFIDGTAPNNVPLQSELEDSRNPRFVTGGYVETDIATFGWLVDHRTEGYGIRGDLLTNGLTDRYRSSIASEAETDVVFPYGDTKPRGYLNRLGEVDVTEYTILLSHNYHLDAYTFNSSYERKPLNPLHDELDARSRIYSTGNSGIYFGGNRTAIKETK